jgi:hypothetical protein
VLCLDAQVYTFEGSCWFQVSKSNNYAASAS